MKLEEREREEKKQKQQAMETPEPVTPKAKGFTTPKSLPIGVQKHLSGEVKMEEPPSTEKFAMSPKQTKLLGRLNELMRSFKTLKKRVKTMQSTGSCFFFRECDWCGNF